MNIHARKIIRAGNSAALIIPPHYLDHIHCKIGDVCIENATKPDCLIISKAPPLPDDVVPDTKPERQQTMTNEEIAAILHSANINLLAVVTGLDLQHPQRERLVATHESLNAAEDAWAQYMADNTPKTTS